MQPGTWVWVRPGALHPGWGDITHLGLLTGVGSPKCELWLHFDNTVHQAPPDRLLVVDTGIRRAARAAGVATFHRGHGSVRRLLPEWEWLEWTVARHIEHRRQAQPDRSPAVEPFQEELFPNAEPARTGRL